ncbi:uncharacterized protein LOC124460379 [Drosophila willistoni]|uniref:uncharacterized protein LOC124460379 n=1 Tax=Drosophila willistoni TaxID=7260 RepID=UPI001F074B3E|nr:uncharacterized protein LOC124460379 [Drosophila willistoni]
MRTEYAVEFSVAFFIFCAYSRADPEAYIAIENGLKSLSNVVVKYQSEFDMKIKFGPLQEAIDEIDKALIGIQGTATSKTIELHKTNKDARLAYQNCVGPVFEWCVSINRTLDLFIPYIADKQLTNDDRNIIWLMNIDALSDGQGKVSSSLELLKSVQNKTADLKILLDAIKHDLHHDLAPQRQDKDGIQESLARHNVYATGAYATAGVIGTIFTLIGIITMGPIGAALGIGVAFTSVGLAHVFDKDNKASLEQQLKSIDTFFSIIDEKITNASKIADQVNIDLEEDKKNLYALSGLITAANRNNQALLNSSPNLRKLLVPSFQALGKSCYEYTIWHGYGSTGYQLKNGRAKRHVTETCKTNRWKALQTRMKSFSLNTTFATIVSQAHSFLMEIDCEEINLPVPATNEISKDPLRYPINPSKIISSQSNPTLNIIASYLKYV